MDTKFYINHRTKQSFIRFNSSFCTTTDIVISDLKTMKANNFNHTAHQQLANNTKEFSKLIIYDYDTLETLQESFERLKKSKEID